MCTASLTLYTIRIVGISIDIMFNAKPSDVINPKSKLMGNATAISEMIKYRLLGSKNNNIRVITKTVNTPKIILSL